MDGNNTHDFLVPTQFTRVEVIDQIGRALVKYINEREQVEVSVQDGGHTLKIFVSDKHD